MPSYKKQPRPQREEKIIMKPITTKLSGVTFGGAQDNIKTFGNKDIGSYALIREPENPHDQNAIRVTLFGKIFMGYMPKEIAKELAPLMDSGRQFMAFFIKLNLPLYEGPVGLTVEIRELPEKGQEDEQGHSSPDIVALASRH
jgi:hypothetical protein